MPYGTATATTKRQDIYPILRTSSNYRSESGHSVNKGTASSYVGVHQGPNFVQRFDCVPSSIIRPRLVAEYIDGRGILVECEVLLGGNISALWRRWCLHLYPVWPSRPLSESCIIYKKKTVFAIELILTLLRCPRLFLRVRRVLVREKEAWERMSSNKILAQYEVQKNLFFVSTDGWIKRITWRMQFGGSCRTMRSAITLIICEILQHNFYK